MADTDHTLHRCPDCGHHILIGITDDIARYFLHLFSHSLPSSPPPR